MHKTLRWKLICLIIILISVASLLTASNQLNDIEEEHAILTAELEKSQNQETDWFFDINYNNLTKSELISELEALQNITDDLIKYPQFNDIVSQANIEKSKIEDCLNNNTYLYPYSDEDKLLLAYMINIEAGANITEDEEQKLVGCVILNRRDQGGINKRLENPTIKDIINEPGQYSICKYSKSQGKNTFYVDLNSVNTQDIPERVINNAIAVLEHKYTCPDNVVYQAAFTQGEIYKSFYHGAPFNNTTYFCYG